MSFTLIVMSAFSVKAELSVKFKTEQLAQGLDRPWAVAALPNGHLVITERSGSIRIWDGKSISSAIKATEVFNAGQGGFLDVKASPEFGRNQTLYFTYAAGSNNKNATYLATAKLIANKLTDWKVLFKANPYKKGAYHYSGRIEFLPDNTLVFAVGDGYSYMDDAQVLSNHFGKMIRLNLDGSVPENNPFIATESALPEIYSYGHRNPQGMFYDSKRQILFSNEHGPKGGDEINIIKPGINYGWPVITYGVDYSGDIISELTHKEGMAQPFLQWTPSIAPSSLMVYYGDEFPELNGHILTTTLKYQELRVVELTGNADDLAVASQGSYLKELGQRIRDIEIDKTGKLFIVTDGGELIKLSAK